MPIVAVSYCWEGSDAPDPEARTLRTVAMELAGSWNESAEPTSGLPLFAAWGFDDVGIFVDFCSLYQNKPVPRTPAQEAAFKRALGQMSMWVRFQLRFAPTTRARQRPVVAVHVRAA